jgi:glycosyltransferase involved in cell wall biosynthesis
LLPLRIGIDARAAVEVPAGRGRVVRELLAALARRNDEISYRCYARTRWDHPLDERFQWRLIAARDPWWHVRAGLAANRDCDVFLSTNSYLTPWVLRIPSVPVIYDMVTFDRALEPNRRSALIERLTLGIAVRRSAAFIAISQATAHDFTARFPSAAGRVTVTPLGVSTQLTAGDSEDALPPPGFVLAVGTLEPRKNLPRLVEAFTLLDEDLQLRHPLVVVGAQGWRTGETLAALRSLGDRCMMLGRVTDEELARLYRRCAVFCYPSLYEGFGLPVLEAMAAGAAVVTSPNSSLPEVGGDAVRYADPRDPRSIAEAIGALLISPAQRAELGAAARARSAAFDWDTTAEVVLDVLRGVAPRRGQASGSNAS